MTFPFPTFTTNVGFDFIDTISVSTNNYNVKAAAISAGWDEVVPLRATVTINNSVVVGSTSTSTPAFTSGTTFPSGSFLTIYNNGTIKGKGGAGTACRWVSASSGYWAPNGGGEAGGTALTTTLTTIVVNTGTIAGGGGGGAYIGGYTAGGSTSGGAAGGGGAGSNVGEAASLTHEFFGGLANSAAGTSTTGGVGSTYDSITGPSGGNLGTAGDGGTYYTFGGGSVGTAGGAAGLCVSGKAYVNSGAGVTDGTLYGVQS
jgi:hypothetical protein